MKKTLLHRITLCNLLFCLPLMAFAQIPEGYYKGTVNKKERELKTALSSAISVHQQRSYNQLWTDFQTTDAHEDGSVWDMYSSLKQYTFIKEQCGKYKNEGDCYNREHSFPKSWFHKQFPMYTDLFHLYPTDAKVNGMRGNNPFGETSAPTYVSADSLSKLGPCSFPGYTGTVFEPSDEYKGDFARSYFYMATCYEDSLINWECPMMVRNSYPAFQDWAAELFLKWCRQDPVSPKEKNRNEAVYGIQENRNPFIDFPGLEEYIWGCMRDSVFTPNDYHPYLCATDTLSLLSFNDFHGAFTKDRNIPGAGELVQAVVDEKAKNKNTIVVSVGDNFSGSYFSRISRGNPLPAMFEKMDVKMSAIGNHEFDWGLPYLVDTAAVCMDYVAANIIAKEDGVSLKWLKPYKIIGQRLKNGGYVNIAFVGLSTTDTAVKTSPENIEGLDFINPEDAARIQIATNLKKEGKVDMVVLLIHIGTNMGDADIIEEMNAKKLPWVEGVDAIISGHSHKVVLAEVNNVPIVQAGVNGTHIGKLNFEVKKEKNNYQIHFIGGDTIPVNGEADSTINALVNEVTKKYGFEEVLTKADDDLIHDRNINKKDYTAVGAYVTAAYADIFRQYAALSEDYKKMPVVGVNHYGGLRASILKGDVTKLRAGNVLPFGGHVVAFQFKGRDLKKLLNDGRINKNGFLQTSNLAFRMTPSGHINTITDLTTGKVIKAGTKCIVVLDSFITTGGDGYNADLFCNPINGFNSKNLEPTVVFIDYLKNLGQSISAEKAPLPALSTKK